MCQSKHVCFINIFHVKFDYFREIRAKENITFLEKGTRISYTQPKSYVFVPELSYGNETDNITTINFPILVS